MSAEQTMGDTKHTPGPAAPREMDRAGWLHRLPPDPDPIAAAVIDAFFGWDALYLQVSGENHRDLGRFCKRSAYDTVRKAIALAEKETE